MGYADELVRVTITWRPPPTATWAGEEAVTTFHLRHHHLEPEPFSWDTAVAELPGQLKDKYVAHWASGFGDQVIATGAFISQFKAAHIDAAGHVLQEGALDVLDGSLTGSGGTDMLPPEVAVCISAWAYLPGGFATDKGRKRGRFYLPYIAANMSGSDGRFKSAHLGATADIMQTLFNDIQGMHYDSGEDYWDFVVASKVDATWHNVDWVSIDNKFDSQRRRQHQSGAAREVRTISHA